MLEFSQTVKPDLENYETDGVRSLGVRRDVFTNMFLVLLLGLAHSS